MDESSDALQREICHSYLTVIRKNVSPKTLRKEFFKAPENVGIEDAELKELYPLYVHQIVQSLAHARVGEDEVAQEGIVLTCLHGH